MPLLPLVFFFSHFHIFSHYSFLFNLFYFFFSFACFLSFFLFIQSFLFSPFTSKLSPTTPHHSVFLFSSQFHIIPQTSISFNLHFQLVFYSYFSFFLFILSFYYFSLFSYLTVSCPILPSNSPYWEPPFKCNSVLF